MLISYNWLQTYFKNPLPPPEKLAELLTFHAYEVEGVDERRDEYAGETDYVFDIDVLPNRAPDSLCHRGVAREIAALLDTEVVKPKDTKEPAWETASGIAVQIKEPVLCRRYIAQVVLNVKVGPSPEWLRARLESVGQKSINNLVDITNFVMFDIGQPMHVFDRDKIKGDTIEIRKAEKGEEMTTLDGEEIVFEGGELVIADSDPKEGGILALAGVKGGTKAAIDENTKSVVLESANFNPASVRRSARALGLITDSSRRFENGVDIYLAPEAATRAVELVRSMEGKSAARVAAPMDMYDRLPSACVLGVSVEEVNEVLGTQLLDEEIVNILKRLRFEPEIVKEPAKKIAELAEQYVGVPYIYGASVRYDAPRAFDCSSFVAFLYSRAGIAIPRQAIDQLVYGEQVDEGGEQIGDIVFARNAVPQTHSFKRVADGEEITHEGAKEESVEFMQGTPVEGGVSHNGIFLGDGKVAHAHPKKGVIVESLSTSEKFQNTLGFWRIPMNGTKRIVVTVPHDRLDMCPAQEKIGRAEHMIEEIGRVYGYRNIDAQLPEIGAKPSVNKIFYYTSVVRAALTEVGFSEVQTYSFQDGGVVEVANPIASDKAFARKNLAKGITEALESNTRHAPLLDADDICIFEIGTVFPEVSDEYTALAIGVQAAQKSHEPELLEKGKQAVEEALGVEVAGAISGNILEVNLSEIIEKLPDPPESYGDVLPESPDTTYQPISRYPFALRDVAAWVPASTSAEEFAELIKKEGGELLAREPKLFDEFEKEGRVSRAFSLVFQSPYRTLTDEEVNTEMDNIYSAIKAKGWEAR